MSGRRAVIEINERFAEALALMEEGKDNLFVTGKAGRRRGYWMAFFIIDTDALFLLF